MTLLLLAGIVVLAAVQLATVIYYVKLGMDETTKARVLDGLLLGLIFFLAFQLETRGMRGAAWIGYLVFRCITEVVRKKFQKIEKT